MHRNYRLVEVDPARNPAKENWKDIIPQKRGAAGRREHRRWPLCSSRSYLKDATTRILPLTSWMAPDEQAIQLPDLGSAGGFGGKRDATFGFYSFTSFTDPGTIFKYDYATERARCSAAPS
jgi:prolyl oligopeptidase